MPGSLCEEGKFGLTIQRCRECALSPCVRSLPPEHPIRCGMSRGDDEKDPHRKVSTEPGQTPSAPAFLDKAARRGRVTKCVTTDVLMGGQ